MKSNYDTIYEINNTIKDIRFDRIEGVSVLGDWMSDAMLHPIQYRALTNTRPCDDDPFEGIGWSPSEALRNLLKDVKSSSHMGED